MTSRTAFLYACYVSLLAVIWIWQSPVVALSILSFGLLSAIMALGVNIQWGYAGLINFGAMGFAAVGGAAAVWGSAQPVPEAWAAGGIDTMTAVFLVCLAGVVLAWLHRTPILSGRSRIAASIGVILLTYYIARPIFVRGTAAIEQIDPTISGYLGGLGAPVVVAWLLGAIVAALAAWAVARIALGLRADFLAIATLGISEIIVAVLKNEDWLTRGVKNVVGLPRPVPFERDLLEAQPVRILVDTFGLDAQTSAAILVQSLFCLFLGIVLLALMIGAEKALRSPWGRMMRAIRDNETAARAMGKDVVRRHRQIFIIGSAIIGLAGAMLITMDGQFTPGTYNPLRFTFLIWVMVIVGGSGSNWGSILGGCLIWLVWIEAEPVGLWLLDTVAPMVTTPAVLQHLEANAPQMRLIVMGTLLLIVFRFFPKGLIPEHGRNNRTME